jgi:23S rRNA pseudouridine1911/1915/1917 synthase
VTAADPILEVRPEESGLRLDAFLAQRNLGLTRSQAAKLCLEEAVRIGGKPAVGGRRVEAGDRVEVALPAAPGAPLGAEPIPLEILFEDDHLLVVNKPQGMVVHPGIGHHSGTLVNALLAHHPALRDVGQPHRPGIVHRLDRDTSGLMLVAKIEDAYLELARQVRAREVERRYLALIWGQMPEDLMIIEIPIGRHLRNPRRMAAVPEPEDGRKVRSATTEVQVMERFGPVTLVEARIATGRTHQIRVHLAHQGYPVVGDHTYGLRRAQQEKLGLDAEALRLALALPGQALHAHTLCFPHPASGQIMRFSASPPQAMADLILRLGRTSAAAAESVS